MVNLKRKKERMKKGELTVMEIQDLLKNYKEEKETDWVSEIQELKKGILAEIRRNHILEKDVSKLDKR